MCFVLEKSLKDHTLLLESIKLEFGLIIDIHDAIICALRQGGKIILFGNGGSAADAQHLAAEFVVRYKKNRKALSALALTTDSSVLTAIGNDFNFDQIFVRQLEAVLNDHDIVIGISTSANSKNVILALDYAKNNGNSTVLLSGKLGYKFKEIYQFVIAAAEKSVIFP